MLVALYAGRGMAFGQRVCQLNGSVALSVVAGCADVSRSVMIDVTELVGIVFSGLSALVIEDVEDAGDVICVRARTRDGAVACPACGAETARVHGLPRADGRGCSRRRPPRPGPGAGPADALPGAGLQGTDLPRAGPGHPGPLPAAHLAADGPGQHGGTRISGQGLGAAAAGPGHHVLPAYRAAGPPQDPPARGDGAAGAGNRPIRGSDLPVRNVSQRGLNWCFRTSACRYPTSHTRSEEHTSELQSQSNLVCRLLLEKKKKKATSGLIITKKKKIE